MLSKGVLLLVVFTAGAIAVPDSFDWSYDLQNDEPASTTTQCAASCPVSSSSAKFGYETGKTYEYVYESDIKTTVPGRMAEHSSLHMRSSVQIEVLSTCEMVLRLSDVSLQDSNPTNIESRQHVENAVAFKRGLQSKTMAFSFIDGQIDSICPEADDETWAVNIKRGILSAFQNTMTTLQGGSNAAETDVSGTCPVKYEQLSGGWGMRKVKKTKDLLACTNRQSGQTIFQAVQYEAASDIQSMPLMKSSHSCEQDISNRERIISKTSCSEVHVFRPFAREDSGATTEVTYKLEFQRKTDGVSNQQAISRIRSTLLYDHRLSDEEMADTVREARTSLTNLCRQTEVDVRPDAPGLFNGLVKQMRKLDASNLKRLLSLTKSGMCQKAEQYFRDALPVLGTTGGVVIIRDLMAEGKANDAETDRWLTSIAFISNPTPDMIKEIQPLLTSDFERSALPVSSLINTYCQLYDDQESVEVQAMLKTMEDELRYNCKYETEAQRTRMLKALKAIGNAGNAERVVPTLNRCIANNEVPIALRVAAISAFRRISCSAERTDLISLMENKQADAELRIMAYMAVMQCANGDIIGRIRTMLESDEANQVGSFIWTHLTNLQETSCPMKSDIQNLLKDVVLSKTYDLDKRKFSRNIELSGFSEAFNMGAVLESNLIWSAQSYVPRSAMVNLTVDVFGQSINFVEFGGRAQGLEALLERFFGPGSDNSIRQKRAVIRDEVLNVMDRKYPKMRDDLSLSYYMRVFGNEIRSGEINDFDFEGIQNRFNYLDWMMKLAQENRFDVTRNFLFLDSAFTVPTGVGMPLWLSVEGTATIAITATGKVDILRMLSSPSNIDVNGSIRPSAAIEVRGEMGVCAHFARTGLKTVNLLHTSRILDGKIQLQDGKIFNVDLNLPQEKVEIFSAESHFYVTYRGQDREQQALRPDGFEKKECTGPQITYIFGVELCQEVSLKGPFVAKAYVNKRDTHTGYHFEAGYRQSQAEMTDSVRVSFNTPGSRIDREITADFKVDRANSQLEMNLKSPWKKVSAQGSLVNSAALKRATLRAVLDETLEYSVNAEVQIDDKRTEVRYIPNIRVTYPDPRAQQQTEIVFDGSVVHTRGKKVTANLALRNAFQQPITLDGSVEVQDKKKTSKYDTNIQFSSPLVKGGLVGFVSNSQEAGNTWSSRADLSYQITGEKAKERIVINHKFRDQSTSNLRSYSTDFSWTSTIRPRYNGQVGLELAFSPNSLRTKVEAGIDNMKKVTIVQSGTFDFSGSDKKVNGMVKFELPYKNWDYQLKVDHIHNWETLQSNATLKYGEDKQLSLDVGLKKQNTKFLNLQGEAIFRMPDVEMSFIHSLTERAPREYYGQLSVQGIPRVQNARITSTYKMMPRHEFTADVTVNGWEPISIKTHLNPNLRKLESHAELTYGTKNFMADVNWLHQGTGATSFNTRANAEVAYLGRSHGITADVSRRNQEFTTSLEVKVAENKKFSLSSQVTAIPTEPKVQARFEWPENFVALSANGKYETKGWLTTTNDLEGSIEFTSSVPRLEKIGASFRHDQSAKSMKSNGEVSWATDKKITGDFSYDPKKISLDLTTPFVGYQVIKAEAAHTPKGKQYGHTTKLSWDTNQMVLTITGELNSPSLNGKVTFTSPFKGFESLSTSLRHAVTGDNYVTNADVAWARGQQITVAMNMNHNRNGWAMTNSGDLSVQTPFRGYRVTKLTWSHQNDRSMWKCHKELELAGQKYIVDVDSSHKLTRVARQLTASASFQSPIQGYENLRFSAEYQHDLRGVKSVGKSSVSWGPSNSIEYEHDVTYVPNAALLVKGQLATPFRDIGTIGIDLNNRRSGNTFTAANEINIGRYGRSTLGGTMSYEGYSIDANLRLTTPYQYLERVATSLKNAKQQDVWVTHADFEYAPDKSYSVDTKVGWESQKKLEVEVTTPHSIMRSMKFKSGVTGTLRNFQVSSELEHNTFQDKMTFALTADTSNTRNMNGMVDIRTPFSAFSNFKATASHVKKNAQSCLTTGSYEFNNFRGSLSHDATVRSWVDFNTKSEIEYLAGRKLELTTSFSIDPKIAATATFRSPFPKARELGLTFSHEGPLDNFKSAMELSYNRRDKINSNLEFLYREGTLRVFSRLTTPYQTVERATMEISHSGSSNNFRCDASFELNTQKLAGNIQFQNDQSGIKIKGELETPFQHLRQGTVSLNHNGEWRSFSNNADISYDGYTISATSEFSLQGPIAKFTLRTPYRPVQNVNFNFAHESKTDRTGKGWTNSASLQVNDRTYTGESEWGWVGRQLKGKAVVKIPQEYSIVLEHRGVSIRDFSNTVTLKMDESTVMDRLSFKYTNNLIDAKATVETTCPRSGNHKVEATFKHEGPVSDFTTRATVTTTFRDYNSFSSELTYRGNPNDFTSTLTVSTPFRAMTRMSANVNHRFTGQTLNSGVTVTNATDQQTIATVSYQKDGSSIEAGAKLQTPYNGYENFETSFRFNGDLSNFRTSASVSTPFEGYERFSAELNHAGPWSRFKTSGKFESSPVPSLGFSIDHSATDAWNINTAIDVDIPAGKIATSFSNSGEPGNFRSGLRVATPFRGYNKFEANLEHEGGLDTPKSKVTIKTPFKGYNNFQLSSEKSGSLNNIQLKAELTTSIRNWEKTVASWSHNIESVNSIQMNGQIETSYPGVEKITGSLGHNKNADGFQTTISVETPVQGYERQSLTISHSLRRNIKTTATVETSVPGYSRFSGSFDYSSTRRLTKTSVSVETPIRGYDKFSTSVEWSSSDANSLSGSVKVSTSIRGYEQFSATLNHNGDASQFETTARVITPFSPQVDASIRHRGGLTDFTTGATVEYNSKKVETEVALKRIASRYESSYESSVKINSPCPYVRDFNMAATHNRQPEVKTGSLDVTLNGEKKVDFDYRYTTSGNQEITINIRNPYTMSTQVNMEGSDGRAVVNWDTTRQDSQVKFDFGFKNLQTSDLTDRSIRFKTALPRRTIGFELGYTLSADKFTNRGELQWDSDPESEFLYEIEGTRSSTRYVTAYDGTLKVTSGLHTSTSTFSHKTNPRRKYTTEVVIQTTERLRMSNEVVMTSGGFTHTLLVQHPRFTQDVSIVSEGTLTGNSKGVKTTIKYERQSFTLEGQITDESQYDSLRSSVTFRFAHPNSFTDVQVTGDVFNDYQKVGGNAEIQYQMTRDRTTQKASLKTQVTKASGDFSFELTTPVDTLRLTATNRFADSSNGMYGYEVAAQTNQMNVKAVSELSLRDRSFDAKFYYTTADYLHLFAQGLSPIQATFEMSRYINGESTNDISATISLSDERLLTGRAFIRPGLREDVLQLLRPDQLYPRQLAAKTQQWTRTMSDDFTVKGQRMQQAALPFANAATAIANDVNAKVDEVKATLKVMYDRNEFYVRDMHIAMRSAAQRITQAVQIKLNEMRQSLEAFSNRATRYLAYYNRIWQQRMDEVSRRLAESMQTIANRLEEMRPHWDAIQAKIDELGNTIRNHPRIRAMIDRLNALELSDFLPPSDWQERLQATYANYRGQVEEFMSRPELREVREWLIRRVEETMWMYEYFGYRDQVTLWIEQVRAFTWQTIRAKVIDGVKNYLQLSKNRWTSWDVTRGEYAFQIYVPFDVMNLSFLQRLNLQKYIDYARSAIARMIPDEEWTLIDTVYSYWPSKDVYNWIPPFKSHASITGSQHIMTFDHKFYEFAGECSYLLTRDFVDKSFSVAVNYDKMVNNMPTRKSITVISEGKQIEVFSDAKVTVDGVRSEMPLRVANTTVKRTGNAISIDSDRGFSVFCDLVHDHCSISVSGWYYNKMAGMLGTYDNEPSNDMTTIDNTITDRPETLAYSWTVGQKCRPNNRAIEQRAEPDTKRYQVCAKYFQNSASPFRSCFRQVNPEPYLQMCINDQPSTDEEVMSEEGVCKVAAGYVQECRRHEVRLRLPRTCVRCEVPESGRTYYESSTFKYSEVVPAPKIADVVFIVQHSPCNKDLLDKVKGLVDDLDKAMTSQDLTNTRYAIVGFGGKDHLATPHIHTMDGQIFNSVNKISQGLNKFDLEAGEVRDPMAAIRYAAKMAFRAGASKTFILLACDTCTENSIRYRDLQRALLEGDVRLHVMVQSLIGLKSEAQTAKTAYIFGADLYTVYTRKDVASEDLSGEQDLARYIRVPKDLCVALTQDTDGSYFSARQWLDSRPMIQKRFTDVMVRVIASKAQPTVCQDCECVADELGVGFSQCSNCEARNPYHIIYPKDDVDTPLPNPTTPAPPAPTTTIGNRPPKPTQKPKMTTSRRARPTPRPRVPKPPPKRPVRPQPPTRRPAANARPRT